jgi:hypothetical protein
MKYLLFSLTFLSLVPVKAEVSRQEVGEMLERMVQENVISAQEAQKAKIKMKYMNSQQWSEINQEASASSFSRKPASVGAGGFKKSKTLDLEGVQLKQIQDDLKNIVPEMKN